MMQASYLMTFENSKEELKENLDDFLNDLGAVPYDEEVRINPINNRAELEAAVNQNIEFILKISWKSEADIPILVTFTVESEIDIEPYLLNQVLAIPAERYFKSVTLVYNSLGRERNKRLFPRLMDLENSLREFIIAVVLEKYGAEWADKLNNKCGPNSLFSSNKNSAETRQKKEVGNKLHNYLFMHWLYYIDFEALRILMNEIDLLEEVETRKNMPDPTNFNPSQRRDWEKKLIAKLPFSSILDNPAQVSITEKITEIRELRNRLMHGRYMTESNEKTIELACQLFHRFLVEPECIGDFSSRKLNDQ